jgi:hypothetical protein
LDFGLNRPQMVEIAGQAEAEAVEEAADARFGARFLQPLQPCLPGEDDDRGEAGGNEVVDSIPDLGPIDGARQLVDRGVVGAAAGLALLPIRARTVHSLLLPAFDPERSIRRHPGGTRAGGTSGCWTGQEMRPRSPEVGQRPRCDPIASDCPVRENWPASFLSPLQEVPDDEVRR